MSRHMQADINVTLPCTFIGAILSHEDLKGGKDLHHYRSRHPGAIGGAVWMLTQVVNNFLQVAKGHGLFMTCPNWTENIF